MDPVIGQQRIALDYERLLVDVLHAKVELAALQAQLFQAESNFTRTNALFASKLVAEEKFEEAKNTRDSLLAQVKAQKELIERVEPGLKFFSEGGPNGAPLSPADGLRAALKVQEDKLRLLQTQLSPIALTAPIDGVVTLVHRQPGEAIVAGEIIFQITSTRADRIVGFIRAPITRELKAGTTVEVRTRSLQRQQGAAKILRVGQQLEPISPTLLAAMRLPVSNPPTELGLRVLVSAPAGVPLIPGQQVDVVFDN
jgi:multidrug resistance efflux pump